MCSTTTVIFDLLNPFDGILRHCRHLLYKVFSSEEVYAKKMRLTAVYSKNHARVPQNEKKVPYKEVFPLKLQNKYVGASKNVKEKNCLYEMSLMFACLKDNNFESKLCNSQVKQFQTCVTNFDQYRKCQKQLQQIEVPSPDTVNFTDSQLTYLLRKFPTT